MTHVLFCCFHRKPTPVSTPFAPASFGGKRRSDKEKEKQPSSQQSSQGPSSQQSQPKRARFSLERPAVASLPPTHSAQGSGPLTGRADGPGLVLPALKSSPKLAVQVIIDARITNKSPPLSLFLWLKLFNILMVFVLLQVQVAKLSKETHWVEVDNAYSQTVSGQLSRLKIVRSTVSTSQIGTSLSKAPTILWETVFGKYL